MESSARLKNSNEILIVVFFFSAYISTMLQGFNAIESKLFIGTMYMLFCDIYVEKLCMDLILSFQI